MSREKVSTEFDCRRIHVIVHQSASDKLAVVHSSSLFGAESISGQGERKSVWQGFQYKSKICELLSGKLPRVYIYTVERTLQPYLRLTSVFWPITLKTTAPQNVTAQRKRVSKYDCTINVTKST